MLLKLVLVLIIRSCSVPLGTMSLVVLILNSAVDLVINHTVVVLVMEWQLTKVMTNGSIL